MLCIAYVPQSELSDFACRIDVNFAVWQIQGISDILLLCCCNTNTFLEVLFFSVHSIDYSPQRKKTLQMNVVDGYVLCDVRILNTVRRF